MFVTVTCKGTTTYHDTSDFILCVRCEIHGFLIIVISDGHEEQQIFTDDSQPPLTSPRGSSSMPHHFSVLSFPVAPSSQVTLQSRTFKFPHGIVSESFHGILQQVISNVMYHMSDMTHDLVS